MRLPEPEREWKFHPSRRWRFDYAYVPWKVAVEINGGAWIRGRHNRPIGSIKDWEKINHAQLCGWIVLQFTPEQMRNLSALPLIEAALRSRGWDG